MLVYAALTDRLVDFATNVIGDLGLAGVYVLMFLESACIPIPSEATMLFAGFNVSNGRFTLLEITLVGTIANVMGSWLAYAVGYYGRVDLIEKHGAKIHVSPKNLATADRWFARHGEATVFFARLLPVVRTFISLPAGVAKMPFWRFTLFTLLGCLPWVFTLGLIGEKVGDNWTQWKDGLHYVDYAVLAAIVVGIAYLVIRSRRSGGEAEPATDAPG